MKKITKTRVKGHVRFEYDNEILETYFYSGTKDGGISRADRKIKVNSFLNRKTKLAKYVIFSPIIDC